MRKRIVSLTLVAALALTMTACGSKSTKSSKKAKEETAKSVAEVVKSVEDVVEKGNLKTVKFTGKYDDYTVEVNTFTDIDSKECSADVSVNGKAVTDVIWVNEGAYVNVGDLAKFVDSNEIPQLNLSEMLGEGVTAKALLDTYGVSTDYVGISSDYIEKAADDAISEADVDASYDELMKNVDEKSIGELIGSIGDAIKKVESNEAVKDAVTFDGQMCVIKLNNKNYEQVLEAFKDVDASSIMKSAAKIAGEEVDASDIEDANESLADSIDELISSIADTDAAEDFDATIKFGVSSGNVEFSVNAKAGDQEVSGSMKTGSKSKKLSAPSKSTPIEDVKSKMGN